MPGNDYRRVLEKYAPGSLTSGEIVDETGKVVGRHDGYQGFTVGQRRGIGVAFGEPRYVISTDAVENRVVVGPRESVMHTSFGVSEPNWLLSEPPAFPLETQVQIRYRSSASSCTVQETDGGTLAVQLHEPRFAIATGQAAVFYEGNRVLGGGWIE